jgi:hypothetical protein
MLGSLGRAGGEVELGWDEWVEKREEVERDEKYESARRRCVDMEFVALDDCGLEDSKSGGILVVLSLGIRAIYQTVDRWLGGRFTIQS